MRPSLRLEKRQETQDSTGFQVALVLAAILAAFLIGSLFFIPFGVNPLLAYATLITKGFGNPSGLASTLIRMTPLVFVGLGTIVAWRTGFFYLGFEGALYIGGAVGTWIALNCIEGGIIGPLPAAAYFPLVLLGAFVAAGLWAGVVGFSKAKLHGNEVIVSLMTNYIALLLISYLTAGPMREPGQQPQTAAVADSLRLPFIIPGSRVHAGILLAVGLAVLVYLLLERTKLGYRMVASGANAQAAKYGGINVARTMVISAFLAGGIVGLGGLVQVLGVQGRFMEGITRNIGFTGIVAALLGRLNPFGLLLSSFFYAGLSVGADAMQRSAGIPTAVASTIQALVVMVLIVFDLFRNYRLVLRRHPAALKSITPSADASGETQGETHAGS